MQLNHQLQLHDQVGDKDADDGRVERWTVNVGSWDSQVLEIFSGCRLTCHPTFVRRACVFNLNGRGFRRFEKLFY
jgi:hypothetical protein